MSAGAGRSAGVSRRLAGRDVRGTKERRTTVGQAGKARRQVQIAKPKLSYRDKEVHDLLQMSKRLVRQARKFNKLPPEMSALGVIVGAAQKLEDLANCIATLPDNWKPPRAKRGSSLVVVVGDTVQIREKNAALYEGLFPPGTDLTVTNVRTALIEVKSPSGEQVYVPWGHVKVRDER